MSIVDWIIVVIGLIFGGFVAVCVFAVVLTVHWWMKRIDEPAPRVRRDYLQRRSI